MSCFSKQKIFCNACGKGMLEEFPKVIGRTFKVCSSECLSEILWREVLSNMGKAYKKQNDSELTETETETKFILIESI